LDSTKEHPAKGKIRIIEEQADRDKATSEEHRIEALDHLGTIPEEDIRIIKEEVTSILDEEGSQAEYQDRVIKDISLGLVTMDTSLEVVVKDSHLARDSHT
jgi:hypothetical protein